MRVAYVTREDCGLGHSVRGTALVRAGQRAGVELRAFGPRLESLDDLLPFAPELILGDLSWWRLTEYLDALNVPGWVLFRWVEASWLRGADRWERRISIEPAADGLAGITDRIAPIIDDSPLPIPADGTELRAGYNTWWRATWFGYRDRVRWYTEGSPERQARIDAGGEMTANGADELMAMLAQAE